MATAKQISESARIRFMRAASLRMHGLTFAKIGVEMGVSTARARELVLRFDRNCTYTARWGELKPHEYMALKPFQDWLEFLTEETK
jgi:hypothetical protein